MVVFMAKMLISPQTRVKSACHFQLVTRADMAGVDRRGDSCTSKERQRACCQEPVADLFHFSYVSVKGTHRGPLGIGELGPQFVAAGFEGELEGNALGIGLYR